MIIDGRATREALLLALLQRIKSLSQSPTLAIIQVGNRPDSTAFIAAKKAFAAKIGVGEKHIHLPENASLSDILGVVERCNDDHAIQGIIVQLPLPASIDKDAVIDAIDPKKDVDGLTATNVKGWLEARPGAVLCATARGLRELLAHNGISLSGKNVTVVGRSMLVGKPIAAMFLNENATVTICHSKTADLSQATRAADIIVSATGKPGLITVDHVRAGQTVIDVGITRVGDRFVGDVDFAGVSPIVESITPVPGGVGPMTVLALFENLIDLCTL